MTNTRWTCERATRLVAEARAAGWKTGAILDTIGCTDRTLLKWAAGDVREPSARRCEGLERLRGKLRGRKGARP